MFLFRVKKSLFFTIFVTGCLFTSVQNVNEPKEAPPDWSRPYQPFRIVGNVYYVGTYDLARYLITTTRGNILINTRLAAYASQIKNNIEALGLKFNDTKIILITQAHYDHVGAIAEIKAKTGDLKNQYDEKLLKDAN